MSRRRRGLIALGLVFIVAVIGVVAFGSGGGKPEIKLFFLGYTNVPTSYFQVRDSSRWVTNWKRFPLFLASNTGPCRVRLENSPQDVTASLIGRGLAWPLPGSSDVINPRNTSLLIAWPEVTQPLFQVVVHFFHYRRTDQFSEWCHSFKTPFGRWLGRRFHQRREGFIMTSDPVAVPTNASFHLDDRGQPWPPPTKGPGGLD